MARFRNDIHARVLIETEKSQLVQDVSHVVETGRYSDPVAFKFDNAYSNWQDAFASRTPYLSMKPLNGRQELDRRCLLSQLDVEISGRFAEF